MIPSNRNKSKRKSEIAKEPNCGTGDGSACEGYVKKQQLNNTVSCDIFRKEPVKPNIYIKNTWNRPLRSCARVLVDMDELNFLAKRLNCFSDTELDTFYGMIRHKGFTQLKDLINATYNLDNYTLVQDFRHIAFVGRTHYHALHGRITEAAETKIKYFSVKLWSSQK